MRIGDKPKPRLASEMVHVPEWDAKVKVVEVPAGELEELGEMEGFGYELIARTVMADGGAPLFKDADEVKKYERSLVKTLSDAAIRVNGLDPDAVDAAGEEIESDPTKESSSS